MHHSLPAVEPRRLLLKHSKSIQNRHPWIFSGLVERRLPLGTAERPASDLTWHHCALAQVEVDGRCVGWAADRGGGNLCARMLSWDPAEVPDRAWLESTLARAVQRRAHLRDRETGDALRVLFGEADGLYGVVADRLGPTLVVEYSGALAYDNADTIEVVLSKAEPHSPTVIRRLDVVQLRQEGVRGVAQLESSGTDTLIQEHGVRLWCRPGAGQKTGYYCDQRFNRLRFASYARGARVLDAFCYSGGFGIHALAAGAQQVVFLDSSADALELAQRNVEQNRATYDAAASAEFVRGNAFELLRAGAVGGYSIGSFDLVVLDPPKLATRSADLPKALRAYKELNRAALAGMKDGALLATFSCSGSVDDAHFARAVAWAAKDAGRIVRVVERFSQGADHPVPLNFPEAAYLKGLLVRVEDCVTKPVETVREGVPSGGPT